MSLRSPIYIGVRGPVAPPPVHFSLHARESLSPDHQDHFGSSYVLMLVRQVTHLPGVIHLYRHVVRITSDRSVTACWCDLRQTNRRGFMTRAERSSHVMKLAWQIFRSSDVSHSEAMKLAHQQVERKLNPERASRRIRKHVRETFESIPKHVRITSGLNAPIYVPVDISKLPK